MVQKEAEAALEPAAEMAERFEAELVLFQAVPFKTVPYKASPNVDIAQAMSDAVEVRRCYLASQAECYPDLKVSVQACNGHVVDRLLEASETCQMIIMTSHGHGGFKRWLLGSVTEQLLIKSKLPLLIVHSSE